MVLIIERNPMQPKITIKDHKNNFYSSPQVRLICPSNSELGRLSKLILDKYIYRLNKLNNLKYEIVHDA